MPECVCAGACLPPPPPCCWPALCQVHRGFGLGEEALRFTASSAVWRRADGSVVHASVGRAGDVLLLTLLDGPDAKQTIRGKVCVGGWGCREATCDVGRV